MSGPLRLTLPLPPTLTNSGRGRSRHWRALEREKKRYWSELDMLVYVRKLPRPPAEPIAPAVIFARLHLWQYMDDDNAMARMKWPVDWLRKRGYIADDTRRNLRWHSVPQQKIDRREPRVEVELRPAADARKVG